MLRTKSWAKSEECRRTTMTSIQLCSSLQTTHKRPSKLTPTTSRVCPLIFNILWSFPTFFVSDPDLYNWHQLDLMCSWNLNNCTDYCASMPTLCFGKCIRVLEHYTYGLKCLRDPCRDVQVDLASLVRWCPQGLRMLASSYVCLQLALLLTFMGLHHEETLPALLQVRVTRDLILFLNLTYTASRVSKCGGIHGTSCGWCKSSGKALPGDASGPFAGECERQHWIHKVSQCPCEEMTHCDNIRGNETI